jgi:hypothetical protein
MAALLLAVLPMTALPMTTLLMAAPDYGGAVLSRRCAMAALCGESESFSA